MFWRTFGEIVIRFLDLFEKFFLKSKFVALFFEQRNNPPVFSLQQDGQTFSSQTQKHRVTGFSQNKNRPKRKKTKKVGYGSKGEKPSSGTRSVAVLVYFSLNQQALGIQIPSKKVVGGVFRRLNTFWEGSWIHREGFFGYPAIPLTHRQQVKLLDRDARVTEARFLQSLPKEALSAGAFGVLGLLGRFLGVVGCVLVFFVNLCFSGCLSFFWV